MKINSIGIMVLVDFLFVFMIGFGAYEAYNEDEYLAKRENYSIQTNGFKYTVVKKCGIIRRTESVYFYSMDDCKKYIDDSIKEAQEQLLYNNANWHEVKP